MLLVTLKKFKSCKPLTKTSNLLVSFIDHLGPGDRASFYPPNTMDNHNYMLGLFESFQNLQDKMDKQNLLKLPVLSEPTYYIEAFFDGNLEWTEYAYTQRELQNLKDDAIDCGFTFTVEEVSND